VGTNDPIKIVWRKLFELKKQLVKDALRKPKPTHESLLTQNEVITGKDLIKRKEDKEKELALFKEALEFEERHRKPKMA